MTNVIRIGIQANDLPDACGRDVLLSGVEVSAELPK
jgi:hypothetical protein